MLDLSLKEVARVVDGELHGDSDIHIQTVTIDSREVQGNSLFCAIVGDRVDGHDFVTSASASGSVASLVSQPVAGPHVLVSKTVSGIDPVTHALGKLAAYQREQFGKVNVIAVTGSSGKTSTKDLIGQVLTHHGETVVPVGSANNELGLPLTILHASNTAQNLVLEMGMRGLGHIKYLCDIARPSIAVVTNVGHAHIGEVGSQENIALAKSEIVCDLSAADIAILNADDPFVSAMRELTRAQVMTYGLSDDADVQAINVEQRVDGTSEFDVIIAGETLHITLPLIGQHNVYNALSAIAVARVVGMSSSEIAHALSEVTTVSAWRMQVKQLNSGITLINDAYNANPESMAAALRTLAGLAKRGHSWAVLGLMGELGSHSQEQHDALGRLAVRLDISHLVVVGQDAKLIYMGASQEGSWDGESVWFPDFSTASEYIVEKVSSEDVVLFKASRSAHFEELCDLVEKKLTARQEGAAK